MEVENLAGAWIRVSTVGKAGDNAGAFVDKAQWYRVVDPFECRVGITTGLVFHDGNFFAPAFRLGFDHADGLTIHKQHVICRADIGLVLAEGNALGGSEVDFLLVLYHPAGLLQQGVYAIPCPLFGILINGGHYPALFYFCHSKLNYHASAPPANYSWGHILTDLWGIDKLKQAQKARFYVHFQWIAKQNAAHSGS